MKNSKICSINRLIHLSRVFLLLSFLFVSTKLIAQIQHYPKPKNAIESSVFKLTIGNENMTVMQFMDYHYSHFAFSGDITIEITVLEEIDDYSISPHSHGIKATCTGNKIAFNISQIESENETPLYLVLQINNLPKLVILADPPEKDIPLSSGEGIFNITKAPYNADPTGKDFAQPAIQQAIDDAYTAGGGIIYVPFGVYKVKENLSLKSNTKLYLAPGSVLKAIPDREKYDLKSTIDPLLIIKAEDVRVYGRGEIDGSGFELMNPNIGFCTQSTQHPRRRVIQTDYGKNINIEGVIVKDGTGWTIELMRSDSVRVQHVKVLNHKDISYKIQNDGINSVSSSNTLVNQCFVMTIDDAMCAKARYGDMENCLFTNNIVYNWAAGVKAGMQSVGRMKNIVFQNIDVLHSRRGIAIDTREGTMPITNVTFEKIRIEQLSKTITGNSCCLEFVSYKAPISNITVLDITCPVDDKIILRGNYDIGGIIFKRLLLKNKQVTSESQIELIKGKEIEISYDFKTD